MPFWPQSFPSADIKFDQCLRYHGDDIFSHNPVSDFFYRFWLDLNTDDHKPCRADVKPQIIKEFLDRVVLMDICEGDDQVKLLVRLIGTHVANYYGEIGGKYIDKMENREAVKRIYNTCKDVVESRVPVLSVTQSIAQDKIHLYGYALYMPLFNQEGVVDKILVSVDILSSFKTS